MHRGIYNPFIQWILPLKIQYFEELPTMTLLPAHKFSMKRHDCKGNSQREACS